MRRRSLLLSLVLITFVVAACGGGADDSADDQLSPTTFDGTTTVHSGPSTTFDSTTAVYSGPSITFDGTTAVYSGPSEVAAYPPLQTVRLVNDSDTSVDFGYSPIKPDEFEGVTEQDAIEWGLVTDDNPPWLGNPGHFAKHVLAGETIDVDAAFIAGSTYELWVWKPATGTGHFAAWIEDVAADD